MRSVFIVVLFLLLSVFSTDVTAQDCTPEYSIKYHHGLIARHRPSIRYIARESVPELELFYSKRMSGSKDWHQVHRNPRLGAGFYYADLGADETMGDAYALYGFVNKPIWEKKEFSFNYQVSAGVSYLTAPFDSDENVFNTAIGSNLNVYFCLSYDIRYRVTEKIGLIHGFGFTHYSNGAYTKPNLGFNVVSLFLGMSYQFQDEKNEVEWKTLEDHKDHYIIDVYSSFAVKEMKVEDPVKYFTSTLYIDLLRKISRKRKIGIGTDIFYNEALDTYYSDEEQNIVSNRFRQGLHITFEVVFNRIAFFANLGYYIRNKYEVNGNIYDRVGVKCFINNKIFGVIALKTHFAKADFIEWGVGYSFY